MNIRYEALDQVSIQEPSGQFLSEHATVVSDAIAMGQWAQDRV